MRRDWGAIVFYLILTVAWGRLTWLCRDMSGPTPIVCGFIAGVSLYGLIYLIREPL